jgi:hypothetical protein
MVASAHERRAAHQARGPASHRTCTWVWATIVAASIANAVGVAFPVLGSLIARRELGGAAAWALILAVQGVGSLIAVAALMSGIGSLAFNTLWETRCNSTSPRPLDPGSAPMTGSDRSRCRRSDSR